YPSTETCFERRKRCRLARAPVLPGKIEVPTLPHCLGGTTRPRFADERQIGHRQRAARMGILDAVAVAKGVELLDIAEFLGRLPFDPGAQPDLEGAMLDLQRAGRQCLDRVVADAHRQHARLVYRRRHDRRTQPHRRRAPAPALTRHPHAAAGPLHPSTPPRSIGRSLTYPRPFAPCRRTRRVASPPALSPFPVCGSIAPPYDRPQDCRSGLAV